MNRRRLLAILATSTVSLAGCISSNGKEPDRISTDSEVRKQPTEDHSAVIEFSLINESDDPITVSANGKKPFVYFSRLTGESGSLVLLPGNDPHVFADVASTPTNGCWRFVDADGSRTYVVTHDIVDQITLEPEQAYHVRHQLFYEGEESDCFPDGVYTTDHTVEFHEAEKTTPLSVRLTFSDKRISDVEVSR